MLKNLLSLWICSLVLVVTFDWKEFQELANIWWLFDALSLSRSLFLGHFWPPLHPFLDIKRFVDTTFFLEVGSTEEEINQFWAASNKKRVVRGVVGAAIQHFIRSVMKNSAIRWTLGGFILWRKWTCDQSNLTSTMATNYVVKGCCPKIEQMLRCLCVSLAFKKTKGIVFATYPTVLWLNFLVMFVALMNFDAQLHLFGLTSEG